MKTKSIKFLACTTVTIEIPDDYPEDEEEWTYEQVDEITDLAYDKLEGCIPDWEIDF
jgi:hypothetical protein